MLWLSNCSDTHVGTLPQDFEDSVQDFEEEPVVLARPRTLLSQRPSLNDVSDSIESERSAAAPSVRAARVKGDSEEDEVREGQGWLGLCPKHSKGLTGVISQARWARLISHCDRQGGRAETQSCDINRSQGQESKGKATL